MKQPGNSQDSNLPVLPLTPTTWDYLGLTITNGIAQMQTDRFLLEDVRSGKRIIPVLRFYAWSPPAVSYGYNQVASESIRVSSAEQSGYDIVQRPTGGRALLHKGDLCYAVIARREWHPAFRTLSSTYRAISRAHRLALSKIGVRLATSSECDLKRPDALSPCFAMINPFEVTVRGRKICGSAQFRAAGTFLQHGSLRVCDSWTTADLLDLWPESAGLDADSVTSIEAEIGIEPKLEQVAALWGEAFSEVFQIELQRA